MSSDITWPSANGEVIDFVVYTLDDGKQVMVDYRTDPPTTKRIDYWQVRLVHDGGAFEVSESDSA